MVTSDHLFLCKDGVYTSNSNLHIFFNISINEDNVTSVQQLTEKSTSYITQRLRDTFQNVGKEGFMC